MLRWFADFFQVTDHQTTHIRRSRKALALRQRLDLLALAQLDSRLDEKPLSFFSLGHGRD